MGTVASALRRRAARPATPAQNDQARWSARRTLAFIVAVCGVFWGVIVWAWLVTR